MAGDPLKEVLLKVVQERYQQIAELTVQYHRTQDPVEKAELEQKIQQLQREQMAAQGALQPNAQPTVSAVPAPDDVVLASESVEPKAPKVPSRAALEAQARELQVELLDAARAVEAGGASPNPYDVKHLQETRAKLQAAMQALGVADKPTEIVDLPPKPSPSQQAEADNLVRQSRVFKMRGQKQQATDTLRKAAELAPGAVSVLEALGDDLLERGQAKQAVQTFQKALAIDPKNVSLERKYALSVAKSQGTLSIEEAMNLKFGETVNAADAASVRAAKVLSFFIPGAGQFVLGDYTKGALFLGGWLIFAIWVGSMAGKIKTLTPSLYIPMAAMVVIQIVAAVTCGGQPGMSGSLRKPEVKNRPAPPVDLPFE